MLSYKSSAKHEQPDEWISRVSLPIHQPSQAFTTTAMVNKKLPICRKAPENNTTSTHQMFSREDGGERIYTDTRGAVLPLKTAPCSDIRQGHTVLLSLGYALTQGHICQYPNSSFCHEQNSYKNSSGSNLTSPQAPNVTAILLLRVTNIFS